MKRAGLSVSNNLAEGASRNQPDKKRFFEISRSSVVEIDNCITAGPILNYLTKEAVMQINDARVKLFKLISGLIDSNGQ